MGPPREHRNEQQDGCDRAEQGQGHEPMREVDAKHGVNSRWLNRVNDIEINDIG